MPIKTIALCRSWWSPDRYVRCLWKGTVVRIHRSQVIMSILTKMQSKERVTEAFPRAKFMFPGHQKIRISEKWGLTKVFFFFCNFIYTFLSVLGLHCCVGFCLDAVRGLLTAAASLVAERGLLGARASVLAALGLQSTGLIVVALGPVALPHMGSPRIRGWTCVSYTGRWTLYYWAIWHGWIWKHSGRKAAHLRWLWGQISTHP